jgi:hypothetical protein
MKRGSTYRDTQILKEKATGIHRNTPNSKSPAPSSERLFLVCSDCKQDCWNCFRNEIINCEKYVEVTLGKFFPELTEEEMLFGWFKKDSDKDHTAHVSTQVLPHVYSYWLDPCGPDLLRQKLPSA